MFKFWLAWRYLNSGGNFLNLTSGLALLGMILGVASLVVSMAVVSGYESTLRRAVIDVVGHLLIIKRGQTIKGSEEVEKSIRPLVNGYQAHTPFVVVEAVLAHNKKITGVIIEGADPESVHKVLNLKSRLLPGGAFDLGFKDDLPNALIGKGLAEKFDLKVGDVFRVVTPQTSGYNREKFRPRLQRFNVVGVLSLGRYDYDQRFILTNILAAQDFAEIGEQITGVRIKVDKDRDAIMAATAINSDSESAYWARSWEAANRNLFAAVKYEKPIIFLVIFIIVVAAAFNISSTLFVNVLKHFSDISVLKTLGASRSLVMWLFSIQGLIIGLFGSLMGIFTGLGACYGFVWAQERFGLLSAEVYKIGHIDVEVRLMDLAFILSVSLFICFISALAPALRGARLQPAEGLRYE